MSNLRFIKYFWFLSGQTPPLTELGQLQQTLSQGYQQGILAMIQVTSGNIYGSHVIVHSKRTKDTFKKKREYKNRSSMFRNKFSSLWL